MNAISVTCADSFTVGGVVTGLAGGGLTLTSPGQPDIVVPAGATGFAFPDRVLPGAAYSVSVVRHPQGPAQTCAVIGGSGVVGPADVVTVDVACGGAWSQLAVGGGHTVGIRPDGTLWAWGSNAYGQLGIGTSDPLVPVAVPVQVGFDADWASVSAGDSHTVAVKTDGSLWAWGFNLYGQVEDGSAGTDRTSPVPIATGTTWTSVSAGANHTLAVRSGGTLWSWGDATYGQLGRGLSAVAASVPTQVGTLDQLDLGGGRRLPLTGGAVDRFTLGLGIQPDRPGGEREHGRQRGIPRPGGRRNHVGVGRRRPPALGGRRGPP